MNIFVKTLNQEISCFQVAPTATVHDLKTQISEKDGITTDLQKLVYSGMLLENEKTL